ncbi:MAG: ATP-binding cassette domain-containing protein, partial [Elusimicrobiota bacterium]
MQNIIKMRDVGVSFKGYNALEDINIDIPKSSFISIIGPNGAGKSTFLKLINGLQRPSSGKIRVMGKHVKSGSIREIRKNTAYISQERHNDPRSPVSVFEAVALGRYGKIGLLRSLTPSDRKAIKRALKITGLDALS